MKKIVLILIMFLGGLSSWGQRNIGVEVYCDSKALKSSSSEALTDLSDLDWSLTNLTRNPSCSVSNVASAWAGEWDKDQHVILFDLDYLVATCGSWTVGEQIQLTMTIVKPGHPYNGYTGKFTFTAPSVDSDYFGVGGINLVGKPTVSIDINPKTLTLCQGAILGNLLTATVTNADAGYMVTWGAADGSSIPGLTSSGTNKETANFTGVAAGTYSVVAKVGSVQSKDVVQVTVKPIPEQPVITINPLSACAGDDLRVEVTNSAAGVTYAWTPTNVSTSSTADYKAVSSATKYSVVPELDGCKGPKSNEVNVTMKPNLTAQTPVITCKVNKYDATVTMGSAVGTFAAYTDAACTTLAPNVSWIGSGNMAKFADLVLGTPHTYYFKGDQTCGSVQVTIEDKGQCACGAKLAIAVAGTEFCEGLAKPINITLTKTAEFKTCSFQLKAPDGSYPLTVTKEAGTSWSHTPTQSGTYTIENFKAFDTDGNDCGTVDGTGTVTVTIHPKPTLQSFTVSKSEGCYDEELVLNAVATGGTGAFEYIWTGAGVTGKLGTVNMKIQAGDQPYTVQAKDSKGCLTDVSDVERVLGHRVEVTAIATPQSIANGATSTLSTPTVKFTPATNTERERIWTPADKITGVNTVKNPTTVNLTDNQEYTVVVTDNHGCTGSAKTTVTVTGSKLAVTATGGTECYGKTITLGCTPSGGAGNGVPKNYEYLWAPSAGLVLSDTKIQNPVVDATTVPGHYTASVTVKDGVGSVTSLDVDVIVKEQPKLTNILATPASAPNSITSTLTVDVTPSTASLAWRPADKIASGVTTNNATTQLLTASQRFTVGAALDGCFDEKTVDVTVINQDMTLTAVGSEGCADSKLTVEANPVGGAPAASGYEYKWGNSTPAGVVLSSTTVKKPTIQNSASLKPGTYSIPVVVTDSKNQSKTANAVVVVYGVVHAEGAGICKDATTFDGQITLSNGELPYTIYSDAGATTVVGDVVWNADKTVATIENLKSGSAYSYYVKDKHGCNIARVDLTADCACGAQLVMTQGAKVCALSGDDIAITLLASGGTSYSFDLVNVELGTKVLEVKNETKSMWEYKVKYADRGKYRVDNFVAVTVASPAGCDGNVVPKDGVDVQFYPTPKVDGGPDQKVCGTGTVTLKANGDAGLTYTWDHSVLDGVPFTPTMGQSTVYTVKGTDKNGCWKEDQVEVTANLKPTVAAMATPNTVCRGEVVTLSHNGTADTYVWDNGGQTGANNLPETTTRYTVTGTSTGTGCSDTSSVLVVVNLPAEIVEKPKDRTIAIGKNVTYKVKAIGNNLTYQWQWYNPSTKVWTAFTDNTATSPKVSGAKTESLLLEEVPQAWDGRKVKCIVQGDCGGPMEAEANLWVKECFEIVADLKMGEGIRPDGTPGSAVDGWYCKGTRISLKALVALADPENGVVANPHYVWTIDGLPAAKVIESDSSVLSWVPEYYEDDIVVRVCIYSDGACNEACSKYLRLKARTPDDVKMQIVTSIDPDRMFCPGESVDFTVALKNGGNNSNIHWYRDIFDKGVGLKKTFVMDQKDTWVRAVFEPSPELCVERVISDSVFLRVKEYVQPTLRIENNIHDTIACQGDTLLFRAIWSNAGAKPQLEWQQDIWNRGNGEYALIGLTDKDTWVKCTLTPGNDVCFSGTSVKDTMVIRVRELSSLTIFTDLTDKQQGDELLFTSVVEGTNRNWNYNWYVNGNQTTCVEDSYTTNLLRHGDVVDASISGEKVCQTKVFSNKILINYVGAVSRDTMLVIYQGEKISDLSMLKEGDDIRTVLFRVDIPATYGMASFSPDGKFNYIPNSGFLGTDYVKYVIINKLTKEVMAEGYIYITVKDSERFLVPNLITPNDDGLNDTWKLDFLVNYPNHFIQVFDRNGHVVFEARNYQNDWKGEGFTKGGYVGHINLVNGVYTYVIDLGDKDKTILKSWIEIRANLNRRNYR